MMPDNPEDFYNIEQHLYGLAAISADIQIGPEDPICKAIGYWPQSYMDEREREWEAALKMWPASLFVLEAEHL